MMARAALNPRQREVRRLLVKHRGMIRTQEIADQLGCNRGTVWRDMRTIREHRPIPEAQYLETQEVASSLGWFDDMERQLLDDLEDITAEVENHAGETAQIGFLNVKCNLLGQVRALRQDRSDFLLRIGLLREAPKRLELTTPLSELTDAQVDAEIVAIDRQLSDIGGGSNGAAGSSAGQKATAPAPTETGD